MIARLKRRSATSMRQRQKTARHLASIVELVLELLCLGH